MDHQVKIWRDSGAWPDLCMSMDCGANPITYETPKQSFFCRIIAAIFKCVALMAAILGRFDRDEGQIPSQETEFRGIRISGHVVFCDHGNRTRKCALPTYIVGKMYKQSTYIRKELKNKICITVICPLDVIEVRPTPSRQCVQLLNDFVRCVVHFEDDTLPNTHPAMSMQVKAFLLA